MLVAALASLAACGESGAAADDSQPGAWRPGQQWRLTGEARIGGAAGNGPEMFSSVVDVALDRMGRVWIADGQDTRVFEERGRHVRTIGRKGAGPAGFASIAGMQWDSEDRLWVLDGGNARFAIYDTAESLLETRPREASLTTSPWPGRFDRQGRLYDVDGGFGSDGSIVTSIVRSAVRGSTWGADRIIPPLAQSIELTSVGCAIPLRDIHENVALPDRH